MVQPTKRNLPRRPVDWTREVAQRTSEEPSRIDEDLVLAHQFEAEGPKQSLLAIFLDIPEQSPREYELPIFSRVIGGLVLDRTRDGDFDDPDRLAVWIHDRSRENDSRPHNGTMKLPEFYQALLKTVTSHSLLCPIGTKTVDSQSRNAPTDQVSSEIRRCNDQSCGHQEDVGFISSFNLCRECARRLIV